MQAALVNGRVLTEDGVVDGKAVLIETADRRRSSTALRFRPTRGVRDLAGGLLVPGFIDTQVNGGGGVLFNDSPTVEAIAAIGAAHRPYGTTGFLPTLISDDLSVVDAAMRATEQAIEKGVPGVLGVHIEGPFLNVKRKGIHDPQVPRHRRRGRGPAELAEGRQDPGDPGAGAHDAGHDPAPGGRRGARRRRPHQRAYKTMRQALDHGLTGFTHLFNAMSPLTSREPGVVGAALESQPPGAAIIVDGRHVDPTT
jgi:N-acetylglucosamine-6-phosphate deacetylase